MPQVIIYTAPHCPYCVNAMRLLDRKGATYETIDVSDMAEREKMAQRSGGKKTVPQIFIGNLHVGGFDDLNALDRAGKLDPLLEKN